MPTLRRSALTAVLFWTVGCGNDGTGPDASDIVVSPSPIVLAQHGTAQLNVSVLDADGNLLSGVAVTFDSDDESIVTVSPTGLVTSAGKAGDTDLRVRSSGRMKIVPVTVTAVAEGVVLGPNPAIVPQLGTLQLEATVTDAVGDPVPGAPVIYNTSDPDVVTVTPAGMVTAVGPVGQATIFAQSGTLVGQTSVVVTPVATTLEFGPPQVTLAAGGSFPLSARVLDAIGQPMAGAPVVYAAEPAAILEVTAEGRLNSKGPLGSGTVTAQSGALEVTIDVEVVTAARPAGFITRTVALSGNPYGAAITQGDKLLVIALDGTLHSGQLPGGTFTSANSPGLATDIVLNPAETRAWVSQGGRVTEFDITGATPTVVRSIEVTTFDQLYGIDISADGSTLIVGGGNGVVYFVSVASGAIVHEATLGQGVIHVTRSADGSKVYATSPYIDKVLEIDVASRATRELTLSGGGAQGVVTAVDGSELYVVTEAANLQIFNLATLERTIVALDCGGYGLGITPDNTQLYVACSFGSEVLIIDRTTRTLVKSLALPGTGRRLAVAPDGLTVAVAVEDGSVVIIE